MSSAYPSQEGSIETSNSRKSLFYLAMFYMLLSNLCVSFLGAFVKFGTTKICISLLVFLRFFSPLLIMVPFFIYKRTWRYVRSAGGLNIQVYRAIAMLISQYSIFNCMKHSTLFNTAMVSQTSPIFIPLISYLILGTKVTRWTKFSVVSGLVGIAFVLKPDGGIFNPWSLLGLLGGLTFGLSQVLYGINRTEQRNDVNLFFLFFIASTLSFVIYLITYGLTGGGGESGVEVIGSVPVAMWYVLFGMGLCTVGNQALKGLAYFYANPATLSPMIYITLIFAGVLDWIVFGKVPDGSSVIGAAIILMSVAIKLIFYHQAESKPSVLKRQR